MGLRGPLAKPRALESVRGHPSHRPPAPVALPPTFPKDAARIYRTLLRWFRHYAKAVEAEHAKGVTEPPKALEAALKCAKDALQVACRTGKSPAESKPDDPFETYRRPRA